MTSLLLSPCERVVSLLRRLTQLVLFTNNLSNQEFQSIVTGAERARLYHTFAYEHDGFIGQTNRGYRRKREGEWKRKEERKKEGIRAWRLV
jgi:hypothetical protein